jgi:pyruvate dehydrogenase E2 component (dihydrolipoamide acetyltransferase)
MTVECKLPELGEHVESADLIKIMVSVGDRVAIDQPLLELETDKADFELPSTLNGVIKEIHVIEGAKVKVGQILFTIEEGIGEVHGASMNRETPAAPPITIPAPPSLPSVSAPVELVNLSAAAPPQARQPAVPPVVIEPEAPRPLVPASPSVRRLARELGIEIGDVPGSGPAGRILSEDVMAFAKRIITSGVPRTGAPPLPDFSRWGEIERKEMTGIRRKIAETMSYSWSTIPHVTNFESADITDLEHLRKRFAGKIEAAGGKLTITSIAVKVIASALKVFPHFAASVDMEKQQIILKKYCHIGVAVDTERGLIVPVIRDADRKSILQLSVELARLAEKVRNKKISLEELEGGVFTITNLGGIGGTHFGPIIHAPEIAILGISRSRIEAVWMNGKFEPRLILPISLSYDHRLIDGADAARFLRWVTQALEQPFLLPLEG